MNLNNILAAVAITGIFEGMQVEAAKIINVLESEPISDLSRVSLRALLQMSEENYIDAISTLKPWCDNNANTIDIPHAFFALSLGKTGDFDLAKHWCMRLLEESKDELARNVAKDLLLEIGE